MKRTFLFIGLLLSIPAIAWAYFSVMVAGGRVISGACTPGTWLSQTDDTGTGTDLSTAASKGQAFTTDGSAHSITDIKVLISLEDMDASESGTLSIRIGATDDFTTVYLGEGTLTVNDGTTGWVTVHFDTPVSVSASTQYYFGCTWSLAAADRLQLDRSASDVYASNAYIYSNTGGWALTSSSSTVDLAFEIVTCD